MRVLIAGLGAVGQRHARNVRALRPDVDLHAFRRRRLRHVVTEGLQRDDSRDVEQDLGITAHDDFEQALAARPDAVFVCTPSSMHLDIALRAADAGCHLFIEKPVSHRMDGLARLSATVERKAVVAAVGCQWRFHPVVERLHALIHSRALGTIVKAELHYAEYLPDWHPYEDYRESYAARAELGGGVVLTQIHDYDLAWWLFGAVRGVHATGGRLSELEIDVEDTVRAQLDTASGPVIVSQTFAGGPARRSIVVHGSAARATVDLLSARLEVDPRVADGLALTDYQRNDMFRAEVEDFLTCIEERRAPRVPLGDGIAVLRVALAVKQSLRSGHPVPLD